MEKKAGTSLSSETLLSLISRQLPKTLITTSRSEWNCIKNGTVEVYLLLSRHSMIKLLSSFTWIQKGGFAFKHRKWGRSGYNWATVTKNGTTVKTGDVVSVSGKGRLKIGEINETKKWKYAVEIIRYL
ncbi:hypothetical protein F2Q70_00023099 [Brassica cretica]|uniref:Uncharacterized protein n=1 Tax=Brassica cretica TaxID=69181 RepID=A0A8S9GM61_BRACR|nr:hypothetical protein F2Q70_00023099 [Brassica cretica]